MLLWTGLFSHSLLLPHRLWHSLENRSVGACLSRFGLLSVYSDYGKYARQAPIETFYTEGFSDSIAAGAALIAAGRSEPVPGRSVSRVLVIRAQPQHSQPDLVQRRDLTYLKCQATIFTAPKNNNGE